MTGQGRRGDDGGATGGDAVFLAVVWSITLTGILANTLVGPSLPDIQEDLTIGASGAGAVVAAASLPGFAVAPVLGVLADRHGRRRVLVPCLVTFGVAGLAAALAPSFAWLFAARLAQGFGSAGLVNLAIVLLGDRYEGERRVREIGRNSAVLTTGLAVLPFAGGALAALGGWRLAFVPYGAALAVAAFAARVLPDDRPRSVVPLRVQFRDARPYLADRRVAAMLAAGFGAFLLLFGLALTALPLDLEERFGLGPTARGAVLGLPAVATVVTSLRLHGMRARNGTWPLVFAGFGGFAIGFGAVGATSSVGLVLGAAIVWGVGEAMLIVPLQAYATELAPTAQRGVMVAAWVGAARLGQASGPILAGALVAAVGTRATFVIGGAVAAGLALAGAAARRVLVAGAASVRG